MTDLTKGIIEIDGFVLTKDTKLSDFNILSDDVIKTQISKRGNTYIKFCKPINSNGIDAYADVSFYTNSTIPKIQFLVSVPSELHGKYEEIAKYKVEAAKKWLKGMIAETPTTDCEEGISFHFKDVSFSSFVHSDVHYGLIGGEIDVTFHEA